MAINRISSPNSTPTVVGDYQAQNNLIGSALSPGRNLVPFSGSNMTIGYRFQLGGTEYRVDSATSISGSASPYVKVTPSGDGSTCSSEFAASLSGVTWNDTNSGYYDISGNLYVIRKSYITAFENPVTAGSNILMGNYSSDNSEQFVYVGTLGTPGTTSWSNNVSLYGTIRIFYSASFDGVGSVSITKNGSNVVTKTNPTTYNGYQDVTVSPGDLIGISATYTSGGSIGGFAEGRIRYIGIAEPIPLLW